MEYDLGKLTDIDFEELVRDLLQMHFKIPLIESFKTGTDKGIDLRYTKLNKKTIIQCKHYIKSGFNSLKYQLKNSELPKIKKLNPERYIVVASVEMNPQEKELIFNELSPYIKTTEDIISLNDILNLIRKHDDIVKKHIKLWLTSSAVLKEILFQQFNNSSIVKTEELIRRIQEKAPKYVQTKSFNEALDKLNENKVIIVSGNAGIGKTFLSEMIIYSLLKDKFTPIEIIKDVEEGRNIFDKDLKQVFYYDDFLGKTFSNDLGKNEDENLIKFMDLIKNTNNKLFILTTREHLLTNSIHLSECFQNSSLEEKKVLITIEDYELIEKARILYNHLYYSKLEKEHIIKLIEDKKYKKIIEHKSYTPRLVEWMTNVKNLKDLAAKDYFQFFIDNLNNPEKIWRFAFEKQISEKSKHLLLAIYVESNNYINRYDNLKETFNRLHSVLCNKYNTPYEAIDFELALKELEGSFIKISKTSYSPYPNISFFDPSVQDFIENYITDCSYNLEDLISIVNRLDHFATISGVIFLLNKKESSTRDFTYLLSKINKIFTKEKDNKISSMKIKNIRSLVLSLIKISSYVNSEFLEKMIEEGIQILLKEEDFELHRELIAILEYISFSKFTKKLKIENLKQDIINGVVKRSNSGEMDSYEFDILKDIFEEHTDLFDNDKLNIIKSSFLSYLKSSCLSECKENCDSAFNVELFIDNINEIRNVFEINLKDCSDIVIGLDDIYHEIKDNERPEELDFERNYENASEIADTNNYIEEMFNLLSVKL